MAQLTKGAVHSMRSLPKREGNILTVQIIDIKLIAGSKFRAIISDGDFFDQSFIGGSSHHYFASNIVQPYQIIKVKDYSISEINNGVILTLQEIEPSTCAKAMIGQPQKYEAKLVKAEIKPQQKKPAYSSNKENCEMTCVKTLTSNTKDFTIKARVTRKTDMKEWKNERGAGKLFSINIIDTFNEEISVNFFKEEAEKFYPMIEVGSVYIFKNGQVRISNKKFQTIDNEYTICADKRTEINKTGDEPEISTIKFNPMLIENIPNVQANSIVDVCAGIIEVQDAVEIISKKTGKPVIKRVVKVLDQSNTAIELTLWGEEANDTVFDFPRLPIIIVGKGLRVTNFNGISLSSDRSSHILYNHEMQQTKMLKNWLARNSNSSTIKVLSVRGSIGGGEKPFRNFQEIKQETEIADKEEAYSISARIGFIRNEPEQIFYTACKNVSKCKKKVVTDSSGMYRCESCAESFEHCEFKYILSMKLQDYSECLWVTAFDDVAFNILEVRAGELQRRYIENAELFEETLQKVYMKRIEGIVKVKMNDTPQGKRPKFILSSVQNFDAGKSLKRNLNIIKELLG